MRVAIIFDDEPRPETTGVYCRKAIEKLCDIRHFRPARIGDLRKSDFDLFLRIDDGLEYRLPSELRPAAVWIIDTHLNMIRDIESARAFDFVFTAQRDGAERLKQEGIASAEWLPLACDPLIHRKFETEEKTHDIAFIGNVFPGPRAEAIEMLKHRFPKTFVGHAYFEEMAKTYTASRIVFNRSIANDVNMRVFEALSSGSLLLTNDLAENGQAEFFRDGVHMATYRDLEEMLDKAEFYLKHDKAREVIAAAGRAEVIAKHTYEHRMKRILEKAGAGSRDTQREGWPRGDGAGKMPSVLGNGDGAGRMPALPGNGVPGRGREGSPRLERSSKQPGYYDHARPEILELIPRDARRVLDVGCGAGRLGEAVKVRQSAVVIGIECSQAAARSARTRLDGVIVGDVETIDPDFEKYSFDAIVCGDVLEHLRDPREFLERAREWLRSDGVLIASIPNARHFSVLAGLIDGNWSYEPAGIMDETHLGFFTRRDMLDLFVGSGFQIHRVTPIPGPGYTEWERSERRDQVRVGRLHLVGVPVQEAEEFYVYQYLFTVVPAQNGWDDEPEEDQPIHQETGLPGSAALDRAGDEGPAILTLTPRTASRSGRAIDRDRQAIEFTQDFRRDFDQFDFRGEPFAFVRFGDGERAICVGKPIEMSDGWSSPGGTTSFSRDLIASLECDASNYYIGIPDSCCDAAAHRWYLDMTRAPLERLTFANIFVNANYERFRKLDLSGMAVVASCNAAFVVPENLVERHDEIDGLVERLLKVERPILVAAGPASCVIIHKYWMKAKRKQAIVDVGSAIDERTKGCKTRRYHFPGSPTADRVCRW